MSARVFDDRVCDLGEAPLWHPMRRELFWFDITGRRMLSRKGEVAREWAFDEMHSAAGWIDEGGLLLASESGLWYFDLKSAERRLIAPLETEGSMIRTNDGRADPQGGFWISTMHKGERRGAGAIWRWYRGEMRRLYASLTIPNAICFAPDERSACFCDTPTARIMRVALGPDGWPIGAPECCLDLSAEGLAPDGAVIDGEGALWIALWGASSVRRYAPHGELLAAIPLPAPNTSCPALGGEDLGTLFVTSATKGLGRQQRAAAPLSGQTFRAPSGVSGQAEHRVRLDTFRHGEDGTP
ncbi:SMP-30/gluconolactonase/LRE family protein [Roseovarius aquimarinus]|uniref:SMP-30/gluconolactonase/LRE family protein n=1 Tax=Roseovarius aquimarinus TaxID=1229156 RepID=A0ABW7ICQ8_9RHOB